MRALLFHIATRADWEKRDSTYAPAQFAREGFIHCSTARQLEWVASQRFCSRDDLVVLTIDPGRVGPRIVYENLEGGRENFPHIYGLLNLDAVVATRPSRTDEDGRFSDGRGATAAE